jgi:DNA-binding transcriptional LysR family regulator
MNPDIDLRLVRSFVGVAEELHFGRAALRLHVSQSALSTQIRKLERIVGSTLLRRTSRHVELTPAGATFLDEARRLLADADRAFDAARAVARGLRGRLVVGFLANAAAELTPRILRSFAREHPGVEIKMRQFGFADPSAGLADAEANVALVRRPLAHFEGLESRTLFAEPRVMVTSDRSSFGGARSLSVEPLIDEPFVARRAPRYWRDFWLAVEQREGHPVQVGTEVATVDECFEAILAGRGMAFTQASTERFYARPGLAFVPMEGLPPSEVAIAWRDDAAGPLVREFVEIARREADMGPPVPAMVVPDTRTA